MSVFCNSCTLYAPVKTLLIIKIMTFFQVLNVTLLLDPIILVVRLNINQFLRFVSHLSASDLSSCSCHRFIFIVCRLRGQMIICTNCSVMF